MATTAQNQTEFRPLWAATGVKRRVGAALDTSGIRRKGCLYFLYSQPGGGQQRFQVRPLGLVDGCGNSNDINLAVAQAFRIAGQNQLVGLVDLITFDFMGEVHALIELVDPLGVAVVAGRLEVLAEMDCQRKADIALSRNNVADSSHRLYRGVNFWSIASDELPARH